MSIVSLQLAFSFFSHAGAVESESSTNSSAKPRGSAPATEASDEEKVENSKGSANTFGRDVKNLLPASPSSSDPSKKSKATPSKPP